METFNTKQLPAENDYFAPDGSEIRSLAGTQKGNMAHCRLGPGLKSMAVSHKTIDEVWYFLAGEGEVWRKNIETEKEEIKIIEAGLSLSIPKGTHFQFRNTGKTNLDFIIVSMPPWPGDEEAVKVKGKW